MEDAAGVSRAGRRARLGLLAVIALAAWSGPVAADDATDLVRVLRGLGPPGILWGRLAVEEESPDGPWTPLAGVEVVVYPYAPAVLADLERIRRSARDSVSQFETAIARIQDVLRAYKRDVGAASAPPASVDGGADGEGAAASGTGPVIRQQVSDPAGVFVFGDLPSGEWLLVATLVGPDAPPANRESQRRTRRESRFVTPPGRGSVREVELWVTRVRVAPGERGRVLLSDRARWLVGPLRSGPK